MVYLENALAEQILHKKQMGNYGFLCYRQANVPVCPCFLPNQHINEQQREGKGEKVRRKNTSRPLPEEGFDTAFEKAISSNNRKCKAKARQHNENVHSAVTMSEYAQSSNNPF